MVNVVAIVVAAITAAGSCGYGACRHYNNNVYDPSEDRTPPARPNTPVPNYKLEHTLDEEVMEHVKDMVMETLKQRDSDTDTEIDIKINIHGDHKIK